MRKVIMIGCDLHEESMVLKVAEDRQTPETRLVKNTASGRAAMIADLRRLGQAAGGARVVFAYEASGQGFGLYDQLTAARIECYVLAPTKIARSARRQREKTDEKDAEDLLELLRGHILAGNRLPTVWIPDAQTRDDRELVRMRLEVGEKITALKTQVQSLLKRYQLSRFVNRRQIAAYLGLAPSSNESGEQRDRKGHITHQGSHRVRKVLCQAAWSRVRRSEEEKAVYQRIKAKNPKKGKIAVVASMRRLAVRMWHRGCEAAAPGPLPLAATG